MVIHTVKIKQVKRILALDHKSGLLVGIRLNGIIALIGLVLDQSDRSVDGEHFGPRIKGFIRMSTDKVALKTPLVSEVTFDLPDLFITHLVIEDDQLTQFPVPVATTYISIVGESVSRYVPRSFQ